MDVHLGVQALVGLKSMIECATISQRVTRQTLYWLDFSGWKILGLDSDTGSYSWFRDTITVPRRCRCREGTNLVSWVPGSGLWHRIIELVQRHHHCTQELWVQGRVLIWWAEFLGLDSDTGSYSWLRDSTTVPRSSGCRGGTNLVSQVPASGLWHRIIELVQRHHHCTQELWVQGRVLTWWAEFLALDSDTGSYSWLRDSTTVPRSSGCRGGTNLVSRVPGSGLWHRIIELVQRHHHCTQELLVQGRALTWWAEFLGLDSDTGSYSWLRDSTTVPRSSGCRGGTNLVSQVPGSGLWHRIIELVQRHHHCTQELWVQGRVLTWWAEFLGLDSDTGS